MKVKIPGTAKELVNRLIDGHGFTLKKISETIGVSSKTLWRIRKGISPQPETHLNLILLYLEVLEEEKHPKGEGGVSL
jgi:transcriptional regulator with XRE-family HTH domain